MNKTLANYALAHYKDPSMPTRNGLCQKEARMLVQGALGHKYDDVLVKPSAKEAAISLFHAGIAFPVSELTKHGGLQDGDVLYKTEGSGGFGHVGIFTSKGVIENSTFHWKKTGGKDARGIRTLAQFGAFQVVARFPDPNAQKPVVAPVPAASSLKPIQSEKAIFLNGARIVDAKIEDGHFVAQVGHVLDVLGLKYAPDKTKTTATDTHLKVWKEPTV